MQKFSYSLLPIATQSLVVTSILFLMWTVLGLVWLAATTFITYNLNEFIISYLVLGVVLLIVAAHLFFIVASVNLTRMAEHSPQHSNAYEN